MLFFFSILHNFFHIKYSIYMTGLDPYLQVSCDLIVSVSVEPVAAFIFKWRPPDSVGFRGFWCGVKAFFYAS